MTTAVKVPPVRGFVEKVSVSEVAVAAVTVPNALLLNTTVLFAAVVSNPNPLIVTEVPFAAKVLVLKVTTGMTVATCIAVPLLTVFVVTTAVKLPADVGEVESVTVSAVAVAVVTVPTAPLLKTTVLLPAVVSKPKPLMVMVVAFATKFAELLVTTGTTVATCTADPLLTVLVVTIAVKLPAAVGAVEIVIVKAVAVAAVTVPAAPLLNTTVLLPGVVSKPKPLMVTVLAFAVKLAELLVTTGTTVATCTAEPLPIVALVTTAVRLPTAVGLVENVTVSEVAEAAVTLPIAPLLNTTVLLAIVESKPKPLMVILAAFAPKLAVLLVTTGITVATWIAAPLLTLLVVTIAVKTLAVVGEVENVTVSEVAVAAVTVPTAPSLNATVLLPGVVSKPKPLIVSVVASAVRSDASLVTTGTTVATCIAEPLLTLFVVTTAVKLPAAVGAVEMVTVSEVAVAAVTVPSAPLLKTTVLLPAVVSKPEPLIVKDEAFAAN